jgi:HSP20 family molecular chaperone IbpA
MALSLLPSLFGEYGPAFGDSFWGSERRSPIRYVEHGDCVVFQMYVPGFAPEHVKLTVDVDHGILTFEGNRPASTNHRASNFKHSFAVSLDDFDLAAASTSVEHGVASIRVPKRPPPPPVPVTAVAPRTQGTLTAGYDAATKMSWPPKFEVVDGPTEVAYSCVLPEGLSADNVEVHLERGGALVVNVNAKMEEEKKDEKGNVVYRSSRSLSYGTPLSVPRNTIPQDVSVNLDGGKLRVTVAKHADSRQSIQVKKA